MAESQETATGPDLTHGIPVTELTDGRMLSGRVGDEQVLSVRRGDEFFAIGAHCTHYHGPLAEGVRARSRARRNR